MDAASVGGTLYVYPVTSDNGYFAYYDKSILSAEDMATQEGIISALTTYNTDHQANYKVSFELANSGWYNAAYFFGTGCVSNWETDTAGNFVDYVDTYNSTDGYDALEGMAQLMNAEGDIWVDSSAGSDFASNSAVVVSGTWDSSTVKQLLGEDYAACKLWTVTVPALVRQTYVGIGAEGRTYQLGSFSGSKLLGVRQNTDGEKNAWAHNIANYLTTEECQLERFNENGWGPSNLNAQEDEAVKSDLALTALNEQNQYATPQGDYPGSWWDTTIALGTTVDQNGSTTLTKEQMDTILAAYDAGNAAVLTASDYAYALAGSIEDCSWQSAPAAAGHTEYGLSDKNAVEGTYSVDASGVKHGKWILENVVIEGGGCYVNSSKGSQGTGSDDGDIELGLFRFLDYGEWTGNWGYNELSSKTGFYDWNSKALGGGTDNNIGAIPGTYTITFDYTGDTPSITVVAAQ